MLSASERERFARDGYVVVPGLVGGSELSAIQGAVDRLVAAAPPPDGLVGNHFYWPAAREAPALVAPLYRAGGVLAAAGSLASGLDLAFDQVQVALNIPPYSHRPGRPHIDGYRADAPVGEPPGTFTLLAGLLLTDQTGEDCGNLWVWPGTHLTHASSFARFGAGAAAGFAEAAGYPPVSPVSPADLPPPTQILGRAGDVLLAHYLLGHNIGGNYRSDVTRRALYWRLRAFGHTDRWAACLADPWLEFDGLRAAGVI